MKNAEMLTRCHEIANFLNDDDRAAFDFFQRHPEHDANAITGGLGALLSALICDLKRDINAEECRAAGRLSPLKAAQRVIKTAPEHKPALHGAWIAGGLQCICDGIRAFRLVDHLPGLPSIPDNVEPFDLARCIDPARRDFSRPLELPDVAEVKSWLKAEKARIKGEGIKTAAPICWDFGEGLPYVNAQFLIDALELLPGCTCRISERRPELGGLYLESPAGDGLLMVCRRPQK